MTTRLTLFTAMLVQDSALSVSGLDREATADQPFAIVDGVPTLVGRGIKGSAVAMARRFFNPLPRAVSDDIRRGALRRSTWEFTNATPLQRETQPARLRAGVGIRQKTGARASHILYDREVVPSGTKWSLSLRVDWSHASQEEAREAEGILGYVLARHWKEGRCWLGGGAARGLGWCHLEDLQVWQLDPKAYDRWVASGRKTLPAPLQEVPVVKPTRSWCFRTLDLSVAFGEYKPEPNGDSWGLDMLAVGPHGTERALQPTGDGAWAKPAWAREARTPIAIGTDRAILMDGDRPLLPGASVRGPIRHAFSRAERAAGREVEDPHLVQGEVSSGDPAGKAFGTVSQSSNILIRDARAEKGWSAAKLHMHAEDEFSAGSYGSAKRDAVRLLNGVFPVRVVIEGAEAAVVDPLVKLIDREVALGALGHLPLGGHKTRGSGWGRWTAKPWVVHDIKAERTWAQPKAPSEEKPPRQRNAFPEPSVDVQVSVRTRHGRLDVPLTLVSAAKAAKDALGPHALVAWWCDPTIDLDLSTPPATFGRGWPTDALHVDEVAFYAEKAVWKAARTSSGVRFALIEEVNGAEGVRNVSVTHTPATLHGFRRFSAASTGSGGVVLREWRDGDEVLGFTIAMEAR